MEFFRSWTFFHLEQSRAMKNLRQVSMGGRLCLLVGSYVQLLLLQLRPVRRVTKALFRGGLLTTNFGCENATTRRSMGIRRMVQAWVCCMFSLSLTMQSVVSAIGISYFPANQVRPRAQCDPCQLLFQGKDWGLHLCIAFDLHRFYADSCRSSLPHSYHDANGQRLCILRHAMPCGAPTSSKVCWGTWSNGGPVHVKSDPAYAVGPVAALRVLWVPMWTVSGTRLFGHSIRLVLMSSVKKLFQECRSFWMSMQKSSLKDWQEKHEHIWIASAVFFLPGSAVSPCFWPESTSSWCSGLRHSRTSWWFVLSWYTIRFFCHYNH